MPSRGPRRGIFASHAGSKRSSQRRLARLRSQRLVASAYHVIWHRARLQRLPPHRGRSAARERILSFESRPRRLTATIRTFMAGCWRRESLRSTALGSRTSCMHRTGYAPIGQDLHAAFLTLFRLKPGSMNRAVHMNHSSEITPVRPSGRASGRFAASRHVVSNKSRSVAGRHAMRPNDLARLQRRSAASHSSRDPGACVLRYQVEVDVGNRDRRDGVSVVNAYVTSFMSACAGTGTKSESLNIPPSALETTESPGWSCE